MLPHAGLVLLAATQLGTAIAQGVVPSPTSGPTLESCEKVRERTGPPPNVLSARFTSTGENILVDLDAASDMAGKLEGENFPCAELLDFADVDTAECSWVGATQISAEVSNALNFVPGETVTLRAQTTMLACDDDRCECRVLNDASSVVADPPDLPGVQMIFQVPDAIAVCEEGGLTVDASLSTGSGGRPLHYNWTLAATSDIELTELTALTGGGHSMLRLPSTPTVCMWLKKMLSVLTHRFIAAPLPDLPARLTK